MFPRSPLALPLLVCLALQVVAAAPATAAPPMKGMALGLYQREGEDPPGAGGALASEWGWRFDDMLDGIVTLGAAHVSMVVSWKQHDVKSVDIHPEPGVTIPDARLRTVIRQARQRGLKVFLFPILEL